MKLIVLFPLILAYFFCWSRAEAKETEELREFVELYRLKASQGATYSYGIARKKLDESILDGERRQLIGNVLVFLIFEREPLTPSDQEKLAVLKKVVPWRLNGPWQLLLAFVDERTKIEADEKADISVLRSFYNRYIDSAIKLKCPELILLFTDELVFWEHEQGEFERGIAASQKAFTVVGNQLPLEHDLVLSLKNTTAIILDFTGEHAQADKLYRDVLKTLQLLKSRFAFASVSLNYAQSLYRRQNFKDAETNYRESLRMARELNDDVLTAVALKGLGHIQTLRGQPKEALRSLAKSLEIFLTLPSSADLGVADAWRRIAHAYLSLKQYKEALEAVTRARQIEALKDKNVLEELLDFEAQALAGLGRHAEAYASMRKYQQLNAERVQQEKQAEMSRLKVGLGLTIEEQRNKILLTEVDQQKFELERAGIRQRQLEYLSVGLLVILLIAGILVYQQVEIRRSHHAVRLILDNIEEGIAIIGDSRKVETQLSPYIGKLLGLREGHDAPDLLTYILERSTLTIAERACVHDTISCLLGEEALTWDLNFDRLPSELVLAQEKFILGLHWQAIYGRNQKVASIILSVRDITQSKSLSDALARLSERISGQEQRFLEVLHISPERREQVRAELELYERQLCQYRNTDLPDLALLHLLQQIRGIAGVLDLQSLANAVHAAELYGKASLERGEAAAHPLLYGAIESVLESLREPIKWLRDIQSGLVTKKGA